MHDLHFTADENSVIFIVTEDRHVIAGEFEGFQGLKFLFGKMPADRLRREDTEKKK